jgi:UDP-N-acetylglucosamine 1-carboxyvinyltransferase
MEKLVIEGGARLEGEVQASGAKNAALPAMAASLLASGRTTVTRVPCLNDVLTMGKLLSYMGASGGDCESGFTIDTSRLDRPEAPYELVKTMRASVLVLGPLVARHGRARVSLPGGCAIGERPINLHLMGLEKMGAKVELEEGYVTATAKRLKGARIRPDTVTVTGTENLMMAATLAKGTTLIENAAREPEVADLARMLNLMGAKIKGAGESVIEIEGVDELRPVAYGIIPDRIETGTFIAAAAITGGEVTITGAEPSHLEAVIEKVRETGTDISVDMDRITVSGPERLGAADLETSPFPGFPTDMQAQFMSMMCLSGGTSIIKERIFENRFMHAAELRRMGARISEEGGTATVHGVEAIKGADVMATDLRASASLVVAALAAKGKSTVHRIYHLDRGYYRMEEKLATLGANIHRASES